MGKYRGAGIEPETMCWHDMEEQQLPQPGVHIATVTAWSVHIATVTAWSVHIATVTGQK